MAQRQSDLPPPFDQGVFLVHYNRGREAFQEGRLAEARRELESAQRFRPEDSDVLNLLGLVYFKTSSFPEAEVIYRRLVAENQTVFILHSNLGLILFKQGKIEEAEEHLLRSIELRPNYAKSHLYLGLLYRQKKKLGLALEHLRFGGADKIVREVEAELRGQSQGRSQTAPLPIVETAPARSDQAITARIPAIQVSRTPSGEQLIPHQTMPGSLPNPIPPTDEVVSRDAVTVERPIVEPPQERPAIPDEVPVPSPPVIDEPPSAGTNVINESLPVTAELAKPVIPARATPEVAEETAEEPGPMVPTVTAARRLQDAVDDTSMIEDKRLDLKRKIEGASKTFTLHENGFLEINFKRSVYVKRGTVSSYSGNLKFIAETGLVGTSAQTLVKAVGEGRIFVYEKGRKTFLLDLHDEFIYVEGRNLLALEDTLAYRVEPIFDTSYEKKIDTVKIFGRGSIAMSTSIEPLTLRVTQDYPLSISSGALVAWTGNIRPAVIEDKYLSDVMIEGLPHSFKIRFEGDGVVVSEQ